MTRDQLAKFLANEAATKSELDVLDEREFEVFSILGQGHSPSQIEAECGLTPSELRQFKERIRRKLGLKDEVELIRFVAARGRGEPNER